MRYDIARLIIVEPIVLAAISYLTASVKGKRPGRVAALVEKRRI